MNINRHNYEEFFLLYVDNELTTAQRKIVEAFVAVNPDLQEEFHLIQQSTFKADAHLDSQFITSLLKPVTEETTLQEEQLLLYLDNELNSLEKAKIERALVEQVDLQKEMQWLKRTQAEADLNIVFPNKVLLYKEETPARVFYMSTTVKRWSAAAAVILLLGATIWLLQPKSNEQGGLEANNGTTNAEKKNTGTTATIQEQVKDALAAEMENIAVNTDNNTTSSSTVPSKKITTSPANKIDPSTSSNTKVDKPTTNNIVAKVEDPKINLPENNSSTQSNKTETPTVQPIASTANNISYASYNTDENTENENSILTEERQRRSGLKGLVKKAKRMFERNTGIQSNASEVRFAVFAVNTQ